MWPRPPTPRPGRGGRRAGTAHRPAGEPAPGSQLALFATYELSCFITDHALEADHRRHAEIENIRDLKTACERAASPPTAPGWPDGAQPGPLDSPIPSTKTLRRRVFALVGPHPLRTSVDPASSQALALTSEPFHSERPLTRLRPIGSRHTFQRLLPCPIPPSPSPQPL